MGRNAHLNDPFNRPDIDLVDDARWCTPCGHWDRGFRLVESPDGSYYMHPADTPSEVPVREEVVARLLSLAERLNVKPDDLDMAVYEMANDIAADRVNEGNSLPGESPDATYVRLHDEADRQASNINNGGLESQLAFLLEGNSEEVLTQLLMMLGENLASEPEPVEGQ